MKKTSFLIGVLFICFPLYAYAKTVVLIPFEGSSVQEMFYQPKYYQRNQLNRFFSLREKLEKAGFSIQFNLDLPIDDEVSAIISFNRKESKLLTKLLAYPKEKRWLFCFEPPVVMPDLYSPHLKKIFGKIFVMFDHLVDETQYFKFHYPQPYLKTIENIPGFFEKKLCSLMNGNKFFSHPNELYSERRKMCSFFERISEDEFDLFGRGWQGYRNWKGAPLDKWGTLKNYRFSICYENMCNQVGYITEKIFDVFVSGSVPVYWGASNIEEYVPKECYIDRRIFTSDRDLYDYLKSMSSETYDRYLLAIQTFLESPQAICFSVEHFTSNIVQAIR